MLQRQSRQGRAARQARRLDRQEHAAAFARRARASTGRSTSMPSSRKASISPITARAPRSRASTSRWSGPSIRPPARSTCFPQEITRVLLNLISNGFYAATKRKADADGDGYEPTLAAATKSLGDRVEIRIRDNGTGIPPEVKEKMFNPFFTTKPAGEGHRARPVAQPRHHRQATCGLDRGRHQARRVHRVQDCAAARGSAPSAKSGGHA